MKKRWLFIYKYLKLISDMPIYYFGFYKTIMNEKYSKDNNGNEEKTQGNVSNKNEN